MGLILNIETATKVCSVALAKDGVLVDFKEVEEEGFSHSEKLNLFILDVLKKNNTTFKNLDTVAVSGGPGSYTGLRIGVSTAKGICYAMGIPLLSVSTLASLSNQVEVKNGIKIPMIDARRMEVYTEFYSHKNEIIKPQSNLIVTKNSFDEWSEEPLYLFGNGANKLKELLLTKNINFIDNITCSAKGMCELAEEKWRNKNFEDIAYFEPNYGKEFYTTAKIN